MIHELKVGDMTATVSENLASQQEIRGYGMEDGQVKKFREDSIIMRGLQLKMVKYQGLISPSVESDVHTGCCFRHLFRSSARIHPTGLYPSDFGYVTLPMSQ